MAVQPLHLRQKSWSRQDKSSQYCNNSTECAVGIRNNRAWLLACETKQTSWLVSTLSFCLKFWGLGEIKPWNMIPLETAPDYTVVQLNLCNFDWDDVNSIAYRKKGKKCSRLEPSIKSAIGLKRPLESGGQSVDARRIAWRVAQTMPLRRSGKTIRWKLHW